VIHFIIGIIALGLNCLSGVAADPLTVTDQAGASSMRFEWHVEGPADRCGKACRTWISAVGAITSDTARDFDDFAAHNNIQGATLVIDSEGGSVIAALALGRAIRRFDMTTTVGKTIVLSSNGDEPRAELSPNASCESMCAFLLLGGAQRYVPPQAHVLVHMIWLGDKRQGAQEASYTADELGLVQRDIGSIARYTVEMGGSIELLETALRVPPWKPMYELATEEIHRMRLTTMETDAEIHLGATRAPWRATPEAPSSSALATVVSDPGWE